VSRYASCLWQNRGGHGSVLRYATLLKTVRFFKDEKIKVFFDHMFLDFRKSIEVNVLALAFSLSLSSSLSFNFVSRIEV
jgi:hypothetical protein